MNTTTISASTPLSRDIVITPEPADDGLAQAMQRMLDDSPRLTIIIGADGECVVAGPEGGSIDDAETIGMLTSLINQLVANRNRNPLD